MNQIDVPSPPKPETEVSSLFRLLGTAHELEALVEAELALLGLSLAKVGVLRMLVEADEPVALSDLAERNCCVRSNITQLVDRLEADGLVRRVSDPEDRRVRRAELTGAGRTLIGQGLRVVAEQEESVAKMLTRDDAAALARVLERLSR